MDITEKSQHILQIVKDACGKIDEGNNEFKKRHFSKRFLDIFNEYLSVAVGEVFREAVDSENNKSIIDTNKDQIEYENTLVSTAFKRKIATKQCTLLMNKKIATEKKLIKAVQADSSIGIVESFPDPVVLDTEELKNSSKRIADNLNYCRRMSMELRDRVETIYEAATIFKECKEAEEQCK